MQILNIGSISTGYVYNGKQYTLDTAPRSPWQVGVLNSEKGPKYYAFGPIGAIQMSDKLGVLAEKIFYDSNTLPLITNIARKGSNSGPQGIDVSDLAQVPREYHPLFNLR